MAFSFTGFLKGLLIQNEVDRTKQVAIEANSSATSGKRLTITSAHTDNHTLTLPDATDTLVGKDTTDTLTNKTITEPIISDPILTSSGSEVLVATADIESGSSRTKALTIRTGNNDDTGSTGAMSIYSGYADNGGDSGWVALISGDATGGQAGDAYVGVGTSSAAAGFLSLYAGDSNSEDGGEVYIKGGLGFGHNPGKINFLRSGEGTAGHAWKSANTTGGGEWGVLGIVGGGTNSTTALSNNKVMISSAGAIVESAVTNTTLAYLDATSSVQTQLDAKQALDATLTALAAHNTAGLLTQTAPDTFTGRTLTAGSSKLAVTNGNGVSGNPTVDVTEANLTISNMTGTLAIAHGGTGQTTAQTAVDALLPAQGAASGKFLTSNGTNASWGVPVASLTNPMSAKGDIISNNGDGVPAAVTVGSDGYVLGADSTATDGLSWQAPTNGHNHLVNSAFDYWQSGTSVSITDTGGATVNEVTSYLADQWYVNNFLGAGTTEAVVLYSQVAGTTDGSLFGASVKVTTAPTGSFDTVANSPYLVQPLSNKASLALYNKTVSLSVAVKALGNITQATVELYYKTTEAKLAFKTSGTTTRLGTASATVNSSGFTTISLNGVAVGTSMTTSGILLVVVRGSGVSSGAVHDANNGFVAEQAMLNVGSVAAPFTRQFEDPSAELRSCQRFYCKTFDVTVTPAQNSGTLVGALSTQMASGSSWFASASWRFPVTMRGTPTIATYNPGAANANFRNNADSADYALSSTVNIGTGGVAFHSANTVASGTYGNIHATASARI